jgi:hypothetical protein
MILGTGSPVEPLSPCEQCPKLRSKGGFQGFRRGLGAGEWAAEQAQKTVLIDALVQGKVTARWATLGRTSEEPEVCRN